MDTQEAIKREIIDGYPRQFWRDLYDKAAVAYLDEYEQVNRNTRVLQLQKPAKLLQDRFFAMDYVMHEVCDKYGIACDLHNVSKGTWVHAYAAAGNLGITQSYVKAVDAFPQYAKFRSSLAEAAKLPKLNFKNERELGKERRFYGLIAHNPIGSSFDDSSQKLGSIQLCVPYANMKEWAITISLLEIVALYPAQEESKKATWKKQPKWKNKGE